MNYSPRNILGGGILIAATLGLLAAAGCDERPARDAPPDLIWGERGVSEGWLEKPRAIAIDNQDRLYIVDMTARIQVFTADGQYLHGWRTPDFVNGRPTGLSFDRQGNLMVADTHYFRLLFYTPDGQLLSDRTIGGTNGQAPGQFGFVTDAVQDSQGSYYVGEYGEFDRIQKFSSEGEFVMQWGSHGVEPGQFARPQALAIDDRDRLWVADSCNHRVQVFDASGIEARLVQTWGIEGGEPGQLRYPYGLILDGQGHVYISEFGNHRVQKFTLDGKSLGCWGRAGRGPGELHQSWSLVRDSQGRIHVLDTYNHRVQRFRL